MSLRIRRGPETDRVTKVLDLGELGYATDTYRLYVGDGITSGGRNVLATAAGTGLTWNPTTQKLDFSGQGSGIVSVSADPNPSLGGNLSLSGYNITGTGNINIAGTLTFTNGLGGNLNLNSKNIIGTGNINITGSMIATSYNTALSSYNNASITSSALEFSIGTKATPIALTTNIGENKSFQIFQVIDTVNPSGYLNVVRHRGSLAVPAAVQPGDELGGLAIKAYTDASTSAIAGILSFFVDDTASITPGSDFVKTQLAIALASDTDQDPANAVLINSAGSVTSNSFVANQYMQLPVYTNDAARLAAIPSPNIGMLIFMESGTTPVASNQMQFYNGTSWISV